MDSQVFFEGVEVGVQKQGFYHSKSFKNLWCFLPSEYRAALLFGRTRPIAQRGGVLRSSFGSPLDRQLGFGFLDRVDLCGLRCFDAISLACRFLMVFVSLLDSFLVAIALFGSERCDFRKLYWKLCVIFKSALLHLPTTSDLLFKLSHIPCTWVFKILSSLHLPLAALKTNERPQTPKKKNDPLVPKLL